MATATLAMDFGAQTGTAKHVATISGSRNLVERGVSPDQSLVARCLGGDESAWEDLVRVHTRQVYGLGFRFTGSGSEAPDLPQQSFPRGSKPTNTFPGHQGSA